MRTIENMKEVSKFKILKTAQLTPPAAGLVLSRKFTVYIYCEARPCLCYPSYFPIHHSRLTEWTQVSGARGMLFSKLLVLVSNPSGPIVPILYMFKSFIFHFRPPLLELDFCMSALSVVLVGFIHGSQLSGWFLVENLFIIKCFEI